MARARRESSKVYLREYRSWTDYREALSKIPAGETKYARKEWSGAASVGEARSISDHGWPEGSARVRDISLPIVNGMTETITGNTWGWDVTGTTYDVAAYLNGEPECWMTATAQAARPVITIGANVCSSGGIPAECLEMRGAAVVALTLALQEAGYATRVYMVQGGSQASARGFMRVLLTDDVGGPLDTDRLLFALAHPASTRCLAYNMMDDVVQGHWGGWCPCEPPEWLPEGWDFDLYMPAVSLFDANWKSAESVARWVQETYAKLTANARDSAKGI